MSPPLHVGGSGVRITALDGLRGISILFVVVGHLATYRLAFDPHLDESPYVFTVLASWGVALFFVISGFIITRLALIERETSGRFAIRSFYTRRFFRIIPPFYTYLGVILLCYWLGMIHFSLADILRAGAFVCNLPDSRCGWFTGHSWTLAYEEQFYLAFPLVISLSIGKLRKVIAGTMILLLLFPTACGFLNLGSLWHREWALSPSFSFICVGALMAAHDNKLKLLLASRFAATIGWVAALLLAVFLLTNSLYPAADTEWITQLELVILPFCFALIVGHVAHRDSALTRVLNHWSLQFLGAISYSLYIWQQLFTARTIKYQDASFLTIFPLMFMAAILSYYFIERPSIRLGRRVLNFGFTHRPQTLAKGPT